MSFNSKANKIRIGIDAMGTDNAPDSELYGAFDALKSNPNFIPVFFGNDKIIKSKIDDIFNDNEDYEIVASENDVSMSDEPSAVIKSKQKSSMYLGLQDLKKQKIDAFVSAGNTGAMLATSTLLLGRINGVNRPTIGTFFPIREGKAVLVVDAGATIDSNPKYLYQFGIMGEIYVKEMFGIKSPRVGLLNVGEESSKGTAQVKEANEMLSKSELNFIGNIEGQDIFADKADVVVTDGFTGNILLKFAESFITLLKTKMKEFADESLANAMRILMMKGTMKKVLKDFDYQEYGGVPLLGVNGVVFIGHGKSTPKAVKNMLLNTLMAVESKLTSRIEEVLKNLVK